MSKSKDVDEAYEKLSSTGQNTVKNLVKWMKHAQILEMVNKTEEQAEQMFKEAKAQQKVTKQQFDLVVENLAESRKDVQAKMTAMLAKEGPKITKAMQAAAKAFEDYMKKPPRSMCVIN